MRFQGMEISLSPDQELAYIQDRSSTVFPVTPAASKLTIPTSRFAPLPPIEAELVVNEDEHALKSPEKDDHGHMQYIPVKPFGQTTAAETMLSSWEKGVDKTVVSQSEETSRTKDLRARFDQTWILGSGKDEYIDTLMRGKDDKSEKNRKGTVKERMHGLNM